MESGNIFSDNFNKNKNFLLAQQDETKMYFVPP